jgi:hypothetical protein
MEGAPIGQEIAPAGRPRLRQFIERAGIGSKLQADKTLYCLAKMRVNRFPVNQRILKYLFACGEFAGANTRSLPRWSYPQCDEKPVRQPPGAGACLRRPPNAVEHGRIIAMTNIVVRFCGVAFMAFVFAASVHAQDVQVASRNDMAASCKPGLTWDANAGRCRDRSTAPGTQLARGAECPTGSGKYCSDSLPYCCPGVSVAPYCAKNVNGCTK